MSETFKALVINQDGENFSREVKELNFDFLNEGEVLVKIQYSDLNYKDALILKDGAKLVTVVACSFLIPRIVIHW